MGDERSSTGKSQGTSRFLFAAAWTLYVAALFLPAINCPNMSHIASSDKPITVFGPANSITLSQSGKSD